MFPGSKISDEAGEGGDAKKWRLGPIDLENGVVEVHRVQPADQEDPPSDPAPS
jgi:hypothetical protein